MLIGREACKHATERNSSWTVLLTALKREVLYAYWQWVNTRELRGVAREALALARALLDGNRERVAARAMAATDVIEAEAEVARRDEAVIVAEKNVANAEDQLRLLILNPRAPEYHTPLEPTDSAAFDTVTAAVDPVTRALAERSDLKILRSAIETNSLNVRHLRNEALPDINLSAGFSARAVGGTELIREAGIGTPVIGSLERGFGLVLGRPGAAAISRMVDAGVGRVSGRCRGGEGQRRPGTSRETAK